MARVGTIFQTAVHYPILLKMLIALAPKSVLVERQNHIDMTKEKLRRRMEHKNERPDLVEGLIKRKDEWVDSLFFFF
jgi:hypothetical protein